MQRDHGEDHGSSWKLMEAHGDHVRSLEIHVRSLEIHVRYQDIMGDCKRRSQGALQVPLSETMSGWRPSGWDIGHSQAGAGDMHHQMCLGDSCTPTWYIMGALPPPCSVLPVSENGESAHFKAQKEQMGIEGLGKGGAWSQGTHVA